MMKLSGFSLTSLFIVLITLLVLPSSKAFVVAPVRPVVAASKFATFMTPPPDGGDASVAVSELPWEEVQRRRRAMIAKNKRKRSNRMMNFFAGGVKHMTRKGTENLVKSALKTEEGEE